MNHPKHFMRFTFIIGLLLAGGELALTPIAMNTAQADEVAAAAADSADMRMTTSGTATESTAVQGKDASDQGGKQEAVAKAIEKQPSKSKLKSPPSKEKVAPVLSGENAKRTRPTKLRQAIGWVEEVSFGPVKLEARLDTGITSNQLHAGDLTFFKREGATWARFRLHGVNGELALVEKPLEVRDGKATASKRYPRIRVGFCLAGRYAEDVFKLRDRSGYEHKVLLGRDVLAGFFTVDPARTMTTEAKCQTWDKGVVLEERDNQD